MTLGAPPRDDRWRNRRARRAKARKGPPRPAKPRSIGQAETGAAESPGLGRPIKPPPPAHLHDNGGPQWATKLHVLAPNQTAARLMVRPHASRPRLREPSRGADTPVLSKTRPASRVIVTRPATGRNQAESGRLVLNNSTPRTRIYELAAGRDTKLILTSIWTPLVS